MNINITLTPATAAELDAMLSVISLHSIAPVASLSAPVVYPAPMAGSDKERTLRDTYRAKYGKGFSMKGRDGNPVAILESLESAGWPSGGSEYGETPTVQRPALSDIDFDTIPE